MLSARKQGSPWAPWSTPIAYASVAAASQTLWLTYAPVTTVAAEHYGVSVGAIGWLANIEPLLYVLLAVPAGLLVDRSLRGSLAAGAILSAAGAVLRVCTDDYSWTFTGQFLIAVAQPLLLSAVAKVATHYLHEHQRTAGIALGTSSLTAGQLVALVLGAIFAQPNRIGMLEIISAVFAVVTSAALLVCLLRPGGPSPDPSEELVADGSLRAVWNDRTIRVLCGIVFIGFGVYIALTTWLQALLEPAGVDASGSGVLLVIMLVAGVFGAVLLPGVVARRGAQRPLLLAAIVAGLVASVALAAIPGFAVGAVVLVISGFFNLAALPVVLDVAERRAGNAGGAVASLIWLAGNAGGLVIALAVQSLLNTPAAAFGLLAVFGLFGLPLLRSMGRVSIEQPSVRPMG